MRIELSRDGSKVVLKQGTNSIIVNDGWVDALLGSLNMISDSDNYVATYVPNDTGQFDRVINV